MQSTKQQDILHQITTIASEAGALLMRYFTTGYAVSHKDDKSPVTDADVAANTFITQALKNLTPELPVIAEEDEILGTSAARFWLVDPLDGTRAFVAGEPEFTVNIGLIEKGVPVMGVIVVPAQDLVYYGSMQGGAYRVVRGGVAEKIHVRPKPADGVSVVRSKSHPSAKTEAFLQTLLIKDMVSGSSSVKFCQVAEGGADIYPRFGRTMEWDTAAGHAILSAAGGRVVTAEGEPLCYGKPGFENPHFIAYGY